MAAILIGACLFYFCVDGISSIRPLPDNRTGQKAADPAGQTPSKSSPVSIDSPPQALAKEGPVENLSRLEQKQAPQSMAGRKIEPKGRSRKTIWIIAAVVLAAGVAAYFLLKKKEKKDQAPAASSKPPRPVYMVLFTHIEDNTPAGVLGTPACRTSYLSLRARLIELAVLVRNRGLRWSFEPDWKFLEAALLYEDDAVRASTGGVNVLRYLRDSLGAAIDPHSHENGGYNYTDVADLLERLGAGGSTVIGGHIWDPSLPQFQGWDRFRVPVFGQKYPSAVWRGDILMGSGTPNHVNDPVVSGVWRPKDRDHYWEDDPAGNIACVGAWKGDIAGISDLTALYRSGEADAACMLTASYHLKPADITSPGGLAAIESGVLGPLAALRDGGQAVLTDFTALVNTWKTQFGGRACIYRLR